MNAQLNAGLSKAGGNPLASSPNHGTCWICGFVGPLTGEHRTKKSDLRDVFGDVSRGSEVFWHDSEGRKNRRLKSLDAQILKSRGRICERCNTARTQPHDMSWETLSRALRTELKVGTTEYRAGRAFPYDTRRHLLNVHLYFAKLFGCTIVGEGATLDHSKLARAIMEERAHPNLFLRFGFGISVMGERFTGGTPVYVLGKPEPYLVHWLHCIRPIGVHVMLTDDATARSIGAWHPSHGTSRLAITDFEDWFRSAETMHKALPFILKHQAAMARQRETESGN